MATIPINYSKCCRRVGRDRKATINSITDSHFGKLATDNLKSTDDKDCTTVNHHRNLQDKQGKTVLIHASIKNQISIIEELSLDPYIDVNVADNEGNTALLHASAGGHHKAVQTLIERFPNIRIDQVNRLGQTALIKAAILGRTKCAQALLKAGADASKRDFSRNFCPLEWAKYVGRTECAELIAKSMQEPCKKSENKLPKASNNLKQVACLIAIPIIGGDNLPATARPRVRSAPPIPTVRITPSSTDERSLLNSHNKIVRPNSSMA